MAHQQQVNPQLRQILIDTADWATGLYVFKIVIPNSQFGTQWVNLMWYIDAIKIKVAVLLASIAIILNSLNSVAQTFSVRSNDIVSVFYGLTIQPFGYQTIGKNF
jgi:hypothetical protein